MLNSTDMTLESVVADITDQLYASAERFDKAVASLKEKAEKYGPGVMEELERFIETFETFQTGCFQFYLRSERFGISKYRQGNDQYVIPL
jgi:hypothetical protein